MKINLGFTKILSTITLTLACTSLMSQAALIAKWSFDETSGTTVTDSEGTYPGTLSPTGASFVAGGVSGGAINITKALNGYVTMGNVLDLTSGDFSLVAWVKTPPGDTTPDSLLLGKHAAFYRNGYFIHLNQSTGLAMQSTNRAFFYQGGTGFDQIQASETPVSTSVINDGEWHQVVAVYRANNTKAIYIDGAPAESTKPSQSFIGNSVAFLIGGVNEHGVPKSRLNGMVDEVQIYNHALTDADIDYLFQNPASVVLDCEQKTGILEAQLAAAQNQINTLQSQLAAANGELESIEESLNRLTGHLQWTFRDPNFQLPGSTTAESVDSVVQAIEDANRGVTQSIYFNLQH
jgi:hypothetical protein